MRAAALLLPSILLCLLLASCGGTKAPDAATSTSSRPAQADIVRLPVHKVTLKSPEGREIVVNAELAATREEQERGLMYRTSLDAQSGMLFTMGEERTLTFWMKNTLIPLDILFFDEEGIFVSSATMDPCKAEPCPTSTSHGPASLVLEVPAGFVTKNNIGEGWILEMPEEL